MLSRTISVAAATRRGFATAVADAASGVKVASVDFGQPTSAVTVLVKAGPRFQSKDGLSNVLKNFAFKVCCFFFLLFFDWFGFNVGCGLEYGEAFGSWDCEGGRVVWWYAVCEFDS